LLFVDNAWELVVQEAGGLSSVDVESRCNDASVRAAATVMVIGVIDLLKKRSERVRIVH
jgi:hypothetical protein